MVARVRVEVVGVVRGVVLVVVGMRGVVEVVLRVERLEVVGATSGVVVNAVVAAPGRPVRMERVTTVGSSTGEGMGNYKSAHARVRMTR